MTDEMPGDKYVVFKRADFNSAFGDTLAEKALRERLDAGALDDAVVIRGQDVFAAPTFFNYSNQVITVHDIMAGTLAQPIPEEVAEELIALQKIADHFHELGLWASNTPAKLPN